MASSSSVPSGRGSLDAHVLGHGEPVIFLHAAVADKRMWSDQVAAVGQKSKVIAYDRRGFGRTRCESEDYSSVDDLLAVLGSHGEDRRAILVGCSQGGRVALDAALEHPSRVRGLVLIAPNVPGAPDMSIAPDLQRLLTEQKHAIDAGDVDRVNTIKARLWLDGPAMPEGRVEGSPRTLLLDMNSIVLRSPPVGTDTDITRIPPAFSRLSEITVPTLLIWGDLDFPHIQDRCRVVADAILSSSRLLLTGSAHLPSLDRPDDVSAAVMRFIDHCVAEN